MSVSVFPTTKDRSLMGEASPLASAVCLLGVFLRIVVSEPVLYALGIDYAGDAGSNILSNIHIGSYVIFMSFALLLADKGRALNNAAKVFHERRIFSLMLLLTVFLFAYWALRGSRGVGLLIDTHLPIPMTAIVLSYAPRSHCRKAVAFLIGFALVNSLLGIAEALGKFRFLTLDPESPVHFEEHFRASALLGHPLANAVFTVISLSIVLALKQRPVLKTIASAVFLVSLVGFGGRAAIVLGVFIVGVFIINSLRASLRQMTAGRFFTLMAGTMATPLLLIGIFYGAVEAGMGERLLDLRSFADASAEARVLVFDVFKYMTTSDVVFGIPSDQVNRIVERMGETSGMADIENPWVLMFVQLGAIFFSVWLLMTIAFIRELMRDKSFLLRLAILSYFILASSFNSFGRKDFLYIVMVAAVTCASRGFRTENDKATRLSVPTV